MFLLLIQEELAEAMDLTPDSGFISEIFSLVDKDNTGYVSFRDLMYAVILFSKGKPCI